MLIVLKYIHGKLANLVKSKKFFKELKKLKDVQFSQINLNIEVHAGHGLDYKTTKIIN